MLRTGHLYPRDIWPRLNLLAVWTGGSAGAYLPGLSKYYGDVPIRDHGLSASEGRMTIPFEDGRADGVLDITSHFFEFIPEEEQGSASPTVLEAHELVPGRNYFILLTTASGLYRYNICDVVRCTGFHGRTPRLEFLHKGAHISNVTGEKVSESQVVTAVRESLLRLNLALEHFTLAPQWGDPPGYRLLMECPETTADSGALLLARAVDAKLQELNPEYAEKRRSHRLGPLAIQPLPAGTWRRFLRHRQTAPGASAEQYKHPCLVGKLDFLEKFLAEFVAPCTTREGTPRAA